jgi:hypothetical protein
LDAKKPSRELSVREILSLTFSLYRSKFIQFFLPFLIQGIILGILYYAITWAFPFPETPIIPTIPTTTFYYEELIPWFLSMISTLVVVFLLLLIIGNIVASVIVGFVVKNASDQIEKGTFNFSESFKFVITNLTSLIPAVFIVGILVAVGFLFFIVPGIIVGIMFSMVYPTIIVEQRGPLESLGRSKKLAGKRWLKILTLIIIYSIIVFVTTLIGSAIALPLINIHPIISPLITYSILAFVLPIFAIAITYLYYSMLTRENPQTIENPS